MKVKIRLYSRFERFWHWFQAFLIIFLLITGFEVHGTLRIFGYDAACRWHSLAGLTLLILTAFAIFWHATTGQWRHYQPEFANLKQMVNYYLFGIIRCDNHPFCKTMERKLNPLQALSYLFLKIVLLPLALFSGLAYYLYGDWSSWGITMRLDGMALLHTVMAFMLLLFLVVHVYLTTTGGTLLSYTMAMITGWEEVEENS